MSISPSEAAKHRRRLGRLHGSSLCRCQGGRRSSAARSGVAPVTRNGGTPKDEDLAGCFTVRPKVLGYTGLELTWSSRWFPAKPRRQSFTAVCSRGVTAHRGIHEAFTRQTRNRSLVTIRVKMSDPMDRFTRCPSKYEAIHSHPMSCKGPKFNTHTHIIPIFVKCLHLVHQFLPTI